MSENVSAGVGPKGAAALLKEYGSLENAISAGCFAAQMEKLRLYRSIATMDESAPLPALREKKPSWGKAAALARDWHLNKLADRVITDYRLELLAAGNLVQELVQDLTLAGSRIAK